MIHLRRTCSSYHRRTCVGVASLFH